MENEKHIDNIYQDAKQMLREAEIYLDVVMKLQLEANKRGINSLSIIIKAKNKAERCRNDLHLLTDSVQLSQNF
jgi:coenzyme F420-reducing hydrogenase alpha subunit